MSVRDFIKNSVLNADSYSQVDIGRIALSLRVEFYSNQLTHFALHSA